jgi:2-polyprenyl-3-methyl-5-hydroxy-6-metoxy-1,4-benzoquinol methylase
VLKSHVETRYVEHIKGFGRYRQLLKRSGKAVKESAMFREMSASAYAKRHKNWRASAGFNRQKVGSIDWLAGNLCDVPEMDTGAFDAVISLSSLEHIPLEILPSALAEIQRMVRSDGYWAVTTSATEQLDTWYHEQSLGYCFSKSDIESLFNASSQSSVKPAEIMHLYKKSQYLKENLAFHYRLSGNNGMPWGRWDPLYMPVGFSENKVVS